MERALWALRLWLDSWGGIGRIAVGMARQGFDLQLTRYDERVDAMGYGLTRHLDVAIKRTSSSVTGLRRTLIRTGSHGALARSAPVACRIPLIAECSSASSARSRRSGSTVRRLFTVRTTSSTALSSGEKVGSPPVATPGVSLRTRSTSARTVSGLTPS